ncbi:hydantoinase/oxoprolinase family protein [Salinisphaera sp.]|uniref:hydantoinase/oxoprolinase family protein n=1 Tax=Salinisphaera sp. TaxID=1914330 RepID=UPI000C5DB60A|nr:hydantoinase/oxoprolinase family protein [Salinisphaera sp.]MBS61690.1 hydantoinase [Salinisphaera sp.]
MTLNHDDRSTKSQSGSRSAGELGVDTGGTFTDVIAREQGALAVYKIPSTPDAPEQAVIDGVRHFAGEAAADWRIVHGSTVATNAVLENNLARTAYIANTGFADVLTIGRQARRELYALEPAPNPVPVAPELCFEVDARLDAQGQSIIALNEAMCDALVEQLRDAGVEAVAINLLFAFLNGDDEAAIESALRRALPDLAIARGSRVLPEYGEYERGIATWLNAALGPTVGGYLRRLEGALERVAIMHGAAGTVGVDQAADNAVNLLLSGPAGGLLGARFVARSAGLERVLTLDMGGTSSDVALVADELALTSKTRIAGYPVAVPMVDMHTIGAGGGSIAWLDAGGLLQVGPASAGAEPGPACYGKGGEQPTVTDAHVVLGRLPASTQLGGHMGLDVQAARRAVARIAEPLNMSVEEAAAGILRIADEAMTGALRVISVARGESVADDSLLCFGGAGPLHACALADGMGMKRVLIPVFAGVLSALGMLVARRSRERSLSILQPLVDMDADRIDAWLAPLREATRDELVEEGIDAGDIEERLSADLRYAGQSASLNLAWREPAALVDAFHEAHEARYGHRFDLSVELVNLRLHRAGPVPDVELPDIETGTGVPTPVETVAVHGCDGEVPVYERNALRAGQRFDGPAILRETMTTTWIAPGWSASVDRKGNLLLERR